MTHAVAVACVIILVLILIFTRTIDNFESGKVIEIVVTIFEEDLDWLETIPPSFYNKMTIYNKGSPKTVKFPKATIVDVPNYGKDVHTVLYHVVTNYRNLADVTFFLHGSVNTDDMKKHYYHLVKRQLTVDPKSAIVCAVSDRNRIDNALANFKIDTYRNSNHKNRIANPNSKLEPANIRPLGKWFEHYFPGETLDCMAFKGIFAVSREDVLKRPKSLYETLLTQVSVQDPEVAHYIERVWISVFSIAKENYLPDTPQGFIEGFIASRLGQ